MLAGQQAIDRDVVPCNLAREAGARGGEAGARALRERVIGQRRLEQNKQRNKPLLNNVFLRVIHVLDQSFIQRIFKTQRRNFEKSFNLAMW